MNAAEQYAVEYQRKEAFRQLRRDVCVMARILIAFDNVNPFDPEWNRQYGLLLDHERRVEKRYPSAVGAGEMAFRMKTIVRRTYKLKRQFV